MTKRFVQRVCVLLAACMLWTLLPGSVLAQETESRPEGLTRPFAAEEPAPEAENAGRNLQRGGFDSTLP